MFTDKKSSIALLCFSFISMSLLLMIGTVAKAAEQYTYDVALSGSTVDLRVGDVIDSIAGYGSNGGEPRTLVLRNIQRFDFFTRKLPAEDFSMRVFYRDGSSVQYGKITEGMFKTTYNVSSGRVISKLIFYVQYYISDIIFITEPDRDNDGIGDNAAQCVNTPSGEKNQVNADGCSSNEKVAPIYNVSKIRITPSVLNTNGYLQASEVMAISADTGLDLALTSGGATTVGSSNYGHSSGVSAIDGVAPSGFPNIFHSDSNDGSPFLEISLAVPSTLDDIIIYGRSDG